MAATVAAQAPCARQLRAEARSSSVAKPAFFGTRLPQRATTAAVRRAQPAAVCAAAAAELKSLGTDKWNLTYYPTGADAAAVYKEWYVIDAEGQTLGRLASLAANVLRGKDQATYTPSMDMGNYVVVINADKVAVTGTKEDNKLYHRHTVGRPGGWKVETLAQLRQRIPERIVEKAVKGMLPKGRIGRHLFTHLKVFKGAAHPHAAQQPVDITHRISKKPSEIAAAQRQSGQARAAQGNGAPPAEVGAAAPAPEQPASDATLPRLVRVYAVTDLHADYPANLEVLRGWDAEAHRDDILVCCGDVSEDLAVLEEVLGLLASKHVFFTPGNHELWVRGGRDRAAGLHDSLAKLHAVLELCGRLGVHATPRCLDLARGGRLWIAPLLSYHHADWDTEPDIPGVPPANSWTIGDYSAVRWPPWLPGAAPPGARALAEWVDALNDTPAWAELRASRGDADVITASHFLPYQALLPEKRFLFFPGLARAVGSAPLARRIQQLQPDIHLFGHTHFSWDATLADGVRYVQAPLCSPVERQRRLRTIAFEGGMEAATRDPVAAAWLPTCIYETLATPEQLACLAGDGAGAAAAGAAGALAAGGERAAAGGAGQSGGSGDALPDRSLAALLAALDAAAAAAAADGFSSSAGSSGPSDSDVEGAPEGGGGTLSLESLDEEAHGVSALELEMTEAEPPEAEAAARCSISLPTYCSGASSSSGSGGSSGSFASHGSASLNSVLPSGSSSSGSSGGSADDAAAEAQALAAWAAAGLVPLRWGAMAAPLGAHWSAYYASFPRQPHVTTLAPWVARRYAKRRAREEESQREDESQRGEGSQREEKRAQAASH
eukprot:scaffold19.g1860.t1